MATTTMRQGQRTLVTTPGGDRAMYAVHHWNGRTLLIPVKSPGSEASSSLSYQDYRYTHGGSIFRAAVERAKAIQRDYEAGRIEFIGECLLCP